MTVTYDAIVTGVGSMGSSACYFLAKRGYKVLGLEQFNIPHQNGSHTGQSRIIRKAYFEHSDYIPLLERAYENWKELEDETKEQVYYRTGLLYYGKPDHEMIRGIKRSAELYGITLDTLNTKKHFPQFNIPSHYTTLHEPEAGFLVPEKAITLYTNQAKKHGAEIHENEKLIEWKTQGNEVVVTTNKNIYRSRKLIITVGAWAGKTIPGLENRLKITRQVLAWVKPKNGKDFSIGNFPCWLIADDDQPGAYYGFPILPASKFGEPEGLKLAYHHPDKVTDPDNVNREVSAGEIDNLKYILNKYLPGAFESVISTKTCLYANTPDENFIIDKLPGYEDQVSIACGFSGHGFKFVSVVGEILADLAMEGKSKLPIGFLSAKRFDNQLR